MSGPVQWVPALDRFVVDESLAASITAVGMSAGQADELSRGLRDALLLRERVGSAPMRHLPVTKDREVA